MSDEALRARAEERRHRIVITRRALGVEDVAVEGTPSERVAMVGELTRAAWAMTGKPWPGPEVARTTVRFVPRSET